MSPHPTQKDTKATLIFIISSRSCPTMSVKVDSLVLFVSFISENFSVKNINYIQVFNNFAMPFELLQK